jgi:hypothetical protein
MPRMLAFRDCIKLLMFSEGELGFARDYLEALVGEVELLGHDAFVGGGEVYVLWGGRIKLDLGAI